MAWWAFALPRLLPNRIEVWSSNHVPASVLAFIRDSRLARQDMISVRFSEVDQFSRHAARGVTGRDDCL